MEAQKRTIKHPSWRVYKAIQDCNLNLEDFGLKDFEKYNLNKTDYKKADLFLYMPTNINDDLTNELCRALTDVDYKDDSYQILDCLETFLNVEGRQLLEVMILNGKTTSDICELMECSEIFALTYKSLFFDTSVFKINVDKLRYIAEGTCGVDAELKRTAREKGEDFLKVRDNIPSGKISVDNVLADTFVTAFKHMHMNVDSDDIASQEISQGWANTLLKFAQEMRKTGVENTSISDLVIALQTVAAPRKSIDDLD